MESSVKDSIITHMKAENLLSLKQYVSKIGRSTTTQLLSYLDKFIDNIVSGRVVDTTYFDFLKAFDSFPHEILLGKLKSYGINGKVLEWTKVNVNRMKSDPANVLGGIPKIVPWTYTFCLYLFIFLVIAFETYNNNLKN